MTGPEAGLEAGETAPDRVPALWLVAVGSLLFVGVAAWLVPWDPVPGGALEPVRADEVFSADQIRRAEAFAREARLWSYASLVVSLAVVCWLGFGRRGRSIVGRFSGPWWVKAISAVVVVELLRRLVTLPFAVLMRQHLLEYGLTRQGWPDFAVDLVKGEVVGIVITSLALVSVIGCARRWRRAWPVAAGGVLAGLVLAGSFVYPLVIEPLFNEFEPLPDGPLRADILALADREDVPVDEVLVADASRRTTTLNAYVSGFGSTRRVVVYDNLVDDLTREQTLSVVAHELAHASHRDVVTGSVLGAAGALLGVGLAALLVGARRGRPSLADPAVVPLVIALVALGSLVTAPVGNTISRQIELRADVEALRSTDDPDAFVEMQRQLSLRSLADPTPPALSQFWFGSHPTVLTRTALAERLSGRD